MRLYPEKLASQLKQTLLPMYLVSSDEPLLAQETSDAIRSACRQANYSDRQVFHVERGFDWNSIREANASLSLFAEKRLLELRINSGKPGDQGSAVLLEYLARPAEDTVLLINVPRLDGNTLKTKWAKSLLDSPLCGFIQLPSVNIEQLPNWINQRLAQQGLSADPEAIDLIVARTEGNLLAAVQEIEKLKLLSPSNHLDLDSIQASIADSARYDVFGLVDAALEGDAQRSLRILAGLRSEGVDIPMILWAIARDIRQLGALAQQVSQGVSMDRALARVWPATRKPLFTRALKRLSASQWQLLLKDAQLIDEQSKGQTIGDAWIGMASLLLKMSGSRLPIFQHQ
ncbi:MAG: DNA polymerase III subunit delta [Gammaproteobacteria bacterium]|nr:DNA polymerase III subunit delta [Gammaproteobacteria bacterium]